MKTQTRSLLRTTLAALSIWSACGAALAAYPDHPIKIVVPWPVGGATDVVARLLAQPLSQSLGVPVVVENKAGAGGTIGTQGFVREKPDGYTLLLATSSTNAAAPHLYSKLGFDVLKDFTAVTTLCEIPNVMVVPTKSPWNSIKDIVTAAQKAPGQYTYGSAGVGGSQHLAGAQFKTATGVDVRHVPYKGSGPAATDLIAGHIDMMIDTGSLASIRGGLLKALAVASDKRVSALPNVPTFKEAGYPMLASAWYGLVLPAGAPKDVVDRLNAEVNKLLRQPDLRGKLQDMGAVVMGSSSQEFTQFMASEYKRYEAIVRDSGAPRE